MPHAEHSSGTDLSAGDPRSDGTQSDGPGGDGPNRTGAGWTPSGQNPSGENLPRQNPSGQNPSSRNRPRQTDPLPPPADRADLHRAARRLIAPLGGPGDPASWGALPFFTETDAAGETPWTRLYAKLCAAPDWQPAAEHIFRALELTPRPRCRVVILGQDPYHTPGRAQGLAFSFPPGERPRDSLKNILAELATDEPASSTGRTKTDGDLAGWARQGVLLLNTVLTVPVSQANGHKGWGWERLTVEILSATAGDGPRAFLVWGGAAQKLCARLPREGHLFLESPHPSPLSVHRGFFGSRPFSRTNRWLAGQGLAPVDWSA
ncbi:uracil-DNA glycosylase [Pseudogemmobacter sonorensis]|uniref:uracil-DNA glycosylase n=1 Tax=Pseudogemmobacter sonorensis TaxID=2989681 RepID=UPI0036951E14